MSIKKVVYFSFLPITDFVVKKYYIENLLESSIEVEYLDLSRLFPFEGVGYEYNDKWNIVKPIDSYDTLKSYIKCQNQDTTLYLSQITYNFKFIKLFHLLHKNKCKIGALAIGMLPNSNNKNILKKLVLKNITFNKIKSFLLNRSTNLFVLFNWIGYYSVIFKTGSVLSTFNYRNQLLDLKRSDKIFDINTTDYDYYLEIMNNPPIIHGPYILYIDNYLPFHPDMEVYGLQYINAESFYKHLNSFFDKIESLYGQKVVIAAHPKAEKYKKYNFFNGRTVIFNNTTLLVRDASFLLHHASTTMGLATILNKKMYFLTSKEIEEKLPPIDSLIRFSASELGSPLIYFDSDKCEISDYNIDYGKYERYKYMYMTSKQSEDKRNSEILIEALKNM